MDIGLRRQFGARFNIRPSAGSVVPPQRGYIHQTRVAAIARLPWVTAKKEYQFQRGCLGRVGMPVVRPHSRGRIREC